ncbi:MAG: hypothetical protein ABIC68_06920, partial [Candidatus Omnitrophota bacterium]
MAKPLDQFGGWLKFFYIIQWINLVLGGIAALLIALTIFTAENVTDSVVALISFFNGLVLLVLFYKIIKITVK